ncbi:MAG: hypothetical protein EBZ47_06740 [Chlamydiae bacterium]|nr:hypothetical protein [Chlamydiota bacterium]
MEFFEVLLSTDMYIDALRSKGEYPCKEKLPQTVIFLPQKMISQYLLSEYVHHYGKGFLSKVAFLDHSSVALCSGYGFGAAALAIKLEELIAWGVKRFIMVGVGCVLTSELPIHSCILVHKALGVDGVSAFYQQKKEPVELGKQLKNFLDLYSLKEGIIPRAASCISSDLFFLPSEQKMKMDPMPPADILDFETAALYAITQKRGVEALSLLITSDILPAPEWIPGYDSEATIEELKRIADFAVRFCKQGF